MRPQILYPLFANITTISGIGEASAKQLDKIGISRIVDLIWHVPSGIIDRRNSPTLDQLKDGDVFTAVVYVDKHLPSPKYIKGRIPYKVICHNDSGIITLVFFNVKGDYVTKTLPVGEKRVVSGRAEFFSGKLQMTHPDYILPEVEFEKIKKIEPLYPLTQGFTFKKMNKMEMHALGQIPELPEWIEKNYLSKNKWQSWKTAVEKIHNPINAEDLLMSSPARKRLAFDELLANQLSLAISRTKIVRQASSKIAGSGVLRKKLLECLPFKLTNGQEKILLDVNNDLASGQRMFRLLQGDVGSGKTVVAMMAMLNAVECGGQAVIMAPTEILNRQHYNWMKKFAGDLGINIELITGKVKGAERKRILEGLKSGEINILIGTHAIFQEEVEFKNLTLAVIDEQHRFGVEQRLSLAAKGNNIHILLMTATPIPRTLTMTFYGDMDVSLLTEKPVGRMQIDTRIIPSTRMDEMIEALQRALQNQEKAYWICPLVEESEKSDLAAAEKRYEEFKRIFGDRVGLVHGRMKQDEREKNMSAFASGQTRILVATTVVEVGVDVPDATIMIIEHAERFGLSQLHQLRGRVGRGDKQSSCLLLYGEPLGQIAKERLKIIKSTDDGFKIAEEDLRLRGSGDILGTKQVGFPEFKLANLFEHGDLLSAARDYTKMIMEKDPELKSDLGKSLKVLLYLFEYENQVKYLMAA